MPDRPAMRERRWIAPNGAVIMRTLYDPLQGRDPQLDPRWEGEYDIIDRALPEGPPLVTLAQLGEVRRGLERLLLDPIEAMDDPLHYIEPLHEALIAMLAYLGVRGVEDAEEGVGDG